MKIIARGRRRDNGDKNKKVEEETINKNKYRERRMRRMTTIIIKRMIEL